MRQHGVSRGADIAKNIGIKGKDIQKAAKEVWYKGKKPKYTPKTKGTSKLSDEKVRDMFFEDREMFAINKLAKQIYQTDNPTSSQIKKVYEHFAKKGVFDL